MAPAAAASRVLIAPPEENAPMVDRSTPPGKARSVVETSPRPTLFTAPLSRARAPWRPPAWRSIGRLRFEPSVRSVVRRQRARLRHAARGFPHASCLAGRPLTDIGPPAKNVRRQRRRRRAPDDGVPRAFRRLHSSSNEGMTMDPVTIRRMAAVILPLSMLVAGLHSVSAQPQVGNVVAVETDDGTPIFLRGAGPATNPPTLF